MIRFTAALMAVLMALSMAPAFAQEDYDSMYRRILSMKKIIALLLAAMMLLACCSALAEVPEGYPEIIEGLDFGGETVYIYDWYSTGERAEEPTDDQQLQYDYWDWLEETYNVKIVETTLGTWDGMVSELQNIVTNQDNSKLCIIGISGGFIGPALANGLLMPWTYGLENFSLPQKRKTWICILTAFPALPIKAGSCRGSRPCPTPPGPLPKPSSSCIRMIS